MPIPTWFHESLKKLVTHVSNERKNQEKKLMFANVRMSTLHLSFEVKSLKF